MHFFKTVAILSSTVAALCVLALPMWALGVPGVENQYARGWKMGLNVLLFYPLAWFINYAPYFLARRKVGDEARLRWQTISSAIAILILVVATARLIQAFKTMR